MISSSAVYGPFVPAGTIIPVPNGPGDTIAVVTENAGPVRCGWTFTDPSQLAICPDGFSDMPYQDPALLAASQIIVSYSLERLRAVRFTMATDWPAAMSQTFPPKPHGMTPDDLATNARDTGSVPAGTIPQRDIGS